MSRMLGRGAATVLLAGGLTLGAAGAALAATDYVGGGRWDHGVDGILVYSNYYHADVCHGSTAVGEYVHRKTARAGYTSYANAPMAIANNQAYWRNSC